jgi:tetratricopeptide (TPR) repeat protein
MAMAEEKTPNMIKSVELKDKGNDEFKKGNYQESIQYYTEAIELYEDPTYYANRAFSYLKLSKFHMCIADCDKAILIKPDYDKAYNRKHTAELSLGRIDDAVNSLTKALEINPGDHTLSENMHAVKQLIQTREDLERYTLEKEWEICLKKINALMEKCPHSTQFIFRKIKILAYKGDYDDAVTMIK